MVPTENFWYKWCRDWVSGMFQRIGNKLYNQQMSSVSLETPAFCESRKIITVLPIACQLSLSRAT